MTTDEIIYNACCEQLKDVEQIGIKFTTEDHKKTFVASCNASASTLEGKWTIVKEYSLLAILYPPRRKTDTFGKKIINDIPNDDIQKIVKWIQASNGSL